MKILLIGQGLAGSVMAMQLLERGVIIRVVGRSLPGAASPVAAGVFNPVTGRKPVETWLAPVLFPYLQEFYPALEKKLGSRFYFTLPNFRPLQTQEERNKAESWCRDPALAHWVSLAEPEEYVNPTLVNAPFGGLIVKESGYVEVGVLVDSVRFHLEDRGLFEGGLVDEADLHPTPNGIEYDGEVYDKVIFCTGRWAGLAGLAPLKGEILRLEPEAPQILEVVVNRAGYVAPRLDGTWWAGSTYQHLFEEEGPTASGSEDILSRIGRSILVPFEIKQHLAGIRPSVKDRRPLIGFTAGNPAIGHFNGLGTKGVSLAPYLAKLLCAHILEGLPLPEEVDVNRYTM